MSKFNQLAISLCLCAIGCGDQSASAHTAIHADAVPVALDHQLLFVESANQFAYLLDVQDPKPAAQATRIALPAGAVVEQRRLGQGIDEGLVLCAGERGSSDVEAQPSALVAIDDAGKSRKYTLGTTPFDTLTQSDDGRFAVLYRTGQQDDRTLNNPNELVVVDLEKQPSDDGAVTRKTPDGLGHTLSKVVVSPTLHIVDEDRRLLVVLSAAEVTLFDLNHLDRRATIVQLDETREIDPAQVIFGPPNPTMFVRADSSDNVFMFRFEQHDNDAEGNDFRPTINPIGGGVGPSDIALFGDDSAQRLLVVASKSAQALVVDPTSSKTITLQLGAPADHIQIFSGTSPSDPANSTRALLYGANSNSVTFLDLDDFSDDPEDQLELVTIGQPIVSAIPLLDQAEMVFLQQQGVMLLSLNERTLTPISASASLAGALFDDAHQRLLVGPVGQPWIGTLDLTSGKTDEILLDANIQALVPMFVANRLAVLHQSDVGYVTLLDLDAPSREHAVSVRGFFIGDTLDRSE